MAIPLLGNISAATLRKKWHQVGMSTFLRLDPQGPKYPKKEYLSTKI